MLFWLDAYDKGDGTVFLFGKVLNKENGKYLSCSLAVHNIERSVFALPKKEGNLSAFHSEFTSLALKMRIDKFKIKVCRKKYAFELPNVPAESEYYEIMYSYGMPTLPNTLNGETFHKVFGTNTTALEHLIVKGKLMGPCWLKISNVMASGKNISWCKVEAECNGIECIGFSDEDFPAPPLTVMSINLKTHLNKEHKANEIVCASFVTWTNGM